MLSLFFLYYHYYFFLPSFASFLSLLSHYPCLSSYFASEIRSYTDGGQIVLVAIFLLLGSLFFPSYYMSLDSIPWEFTVKGPYNYIGFILIIHDFLSILRSLNLSANFLLPCKVMYLQLLANQALIVLRGILPTAHISRGNHSSCLTG